MFLREKIFAGLGRIKADTVLKNCRILNVNTKEITKGDIAISSGFISGIGDVDELIGSKTEILDIRNAHVCPGLIDGHVHFESSMVTLTEFKTINAPWDNWYRDRSARDCQYHGGKRNQVDYS